MCRTGQLIIVTKQYIRWDLTIMTTRGYCDNQVKYRPSPIWLYLLTFYLYFIPWVSDFYINFHAHGANMNKGITWYIDIWKLKMDGWRNGWRNGWREGGTDTFLRVAHAYTALETRPRHLICNFIPLPLKCICFTENNIPSLKFFSSWGTVSLFNYVSVDCLRFLLVLFANGSFLSCR